MVEATAGPLQFRLGTARGVVCTSDAGDRIVDGRGGSSFVNCGSSQREAVPLNASGSVASLRDTGPKELKHTPDVVYS